MDSGGRELASLLHLYVQVTLWNFMKYNVVGGGDSSLYGVESSTFYLRNAFTNLNLVVPLALLAPLSALVLMLQRKGAHPHGEYLILPLQLEGACRFAVVDVGSRSAAS